MAVSSPPQKDQPLLQLQKVDSSRLGARVVSPILGAPLETSQPICIPSPYTDLNHDFSGIPFYGPTIFSYASPAISDRASIHRSMSPSLFWPPHGHVGPHMPHHHSQTRPQHGQLIQSPWAELSPLDRCGGTSWQVAKLVSAKVISHGLDCCCSLHAKEDQNGGRIRDLLSQGTFSELVVDRHI